MMTNRVVFYLLLVFLCVLKYVSGLACREKCFEETNGVLSDEKQAMGVDMIVDACSFGCRMATIDELLSPGLANLTWCRKYCVDGYNTLEEIRSCIVGCNNTMEKSHPPSVSSADYQSMIPEGGSSILYDYFIPIITYSLTLFSDNETGVQEQEQMNGTGWEYIQIFIIGSSDSNTVAPADDTMLLDHTSHNCLWAALQFLCFVMFLVSFALCFCMFFTNDERKEKYNKHKPVFNPISVPVDIYTIPIKMGEEKKPFIMFK